jgi:hypothetical protein
LRAATSSRTVTAVAIVGLIVVSLLIFNEFDSASLLNPMSPIVGGPNNPGPTPDYNGTLVVQLSSNQNQNNKSLSVPLNQSTPLGNWPVIVTTPNSTSGYSSYSLTQQFSLTTKADGQAVMQITAGSWDVEISDETLNMTIPIPIYAGNETLLQVDVTGTVYPLIYSEESGLLLTPISAQYATFAELRSSTSVANVSAPVILRVAEGTGGYDVNATVVSQEPPTQGTQWLQLGTASAVDPVNATSIYLTSWTYSSSTTITVSSLLVGSLK